MKPRHLGAALLAMAFFGASSIANADQAVDGNFMYSMCTDGNQVDAFGCLEFVAGWAEGASMQAAVDETHPVFCLPSKILYVQFRDIFINYLIAHPEKRQYPAATLLAISISQAFPCQTPSGK